MVFKPPNPLPKFADLKVTLAQSGQTDNALYQTISVLIDRLHQFRTGVVDATSKPDNGSGGGAVELHAPTHSQGGGDAVDVKNLAGYPGTIDVFLRGDKTFAAAGTGGPHAPTHSAIGTDPVTVTNLAGYPGGTVNFLRADGIFATPPVNTGPAGPQGPVGLTGATGPQGPIGLTGPQGNTGATGNTGPQGIQGPIGNTGSQGPIGNTGPAGTPGERWFAFNGVPGTAGEPVGAIVGDWYLNTTNGDVYEFTALPNVWTLRANIKGPQGIQGATGSQGPIGNTGPQGPIGNTGATGPQGIQGIQGPIGNTGPAGADAAIVADAQYWVSTAHGVLSAERNIGALASGYVKSTVAAGVSTPSTVVSIPIADGGTGVTTGLTVLNADNLTSGTVPAARLTAANLPNHATRHQSGGADVVDVKLLGGYPGGTANFLRADGTFAAPPTGGIPSAHQATHQIGGGDELLNNAWTNVVNVFTQNQTLNKINPRILLTDTAQTTNEKTFAIFNNNLLFQIHALNDAGTPVGQPIGINRGGDLNVGANLTVVGSSGNVACKDQANTFTLVQAITGSDARLALTGGSNVWTNLQATPNGTELNENTFFNGSGYSLANGSYASWIIRLSGTIDSFTLYHAVAGSVGYNSFFSIDSIGALRCRGSIYEQDRSYALGRRVPWTPTLYSAEGADCGGTMNCYYAVIGDVLYWSVYIVNFNNPINGTQYMRFSMPVGFPPAIPDVETSIVRIFVPGIGDNVGMTQNNASGGYPGFIQIYRIPIVGWPAGVGHIIGQGHYFIS